MRIAILLLAVVCSGCYTTYLNDARIDGIESSYRGNGSVESLAYSREAMVFTDRIDQPLAEFSDPNTGEERRAQIRKDLEFIKTLRDKAESMIPVQGKVRNETRKTVQVRIRQWPSRTLVASFKLLGHESKSLALLSGEKYIFEYTDSAGNKWTHVTEDPISRLEPWSSRLHSAF